MIKQRDSQLETRCLPTIEYILLNKMELLPARREVYTKAVR